MLKRNSVFVSLSVCLYTARGTNRFVILCLVFFYLISHYSFMLNPISWILPSKFLIQFLILLLFRYLMLQLSLLCNNCTPLSVCLSPLYVFCDLMPALLWPLWTVGTCSSAEYRTALLYLSVNRGRHCCVCGLIEDGTVVFVG